MKAQIYFNEDIQDIAYPSELGDMMADCYLKISPGRDTTITIPCGLNNLFDLVEKAVSIKLIRDIKEIELPFTKVDNSITIVGYSSGLDSMAQALYQRANGKKVFLFHIKHLNKSYPDEFEKAVLFAKDFNFPLIVIDPKFVKQTAYIDNPIKNQTILSYAIDYGRSIGCVNYAMGNYKTDRLSDKIKNNVQKYETTDSVELFEAYNAYVRSKAKAYTYSYMPFPKYDALDFIRKNNPSALPYINSCMRPYRFKDYTHNQTVLKYGVPLISHHCGVCFKCAKEYLMLADMKYYPINESYAKKCISIIRDKDGTTYTLNITKGASDREVLEKVFEKEIAMSRWGNVINKK